MYSVCKAWSDREDNVLHSIATEKQQKTGTTGKVKRRTENVQERKGLHSASRQQKRGIGIINISSNDGEAGSQVSHISQMHYFAGTTWASSQIPRILGHDGDHQLLQLRHRLWRLSDIAWRHGNTCVEAGSRRMERRDNGLEIGDALVQHGDLRGDAPDTRQCTLQWSPSRGSIWW